MRTVGAPDPRRSAPSSGTHKRAGTKASVGHALVPRCAGVGSTCPCRSFHTPRCDPAPAGPQKLSKDVLRRRGEQRGPAWRGGGRLACSWACDAAYPLVLPQVWDPVMIIGQIVSVQCVFYITLGLWQTLLVGEAPAAPRLHAPGPHAPPSPGTSPGTPTAAGTQACCSSRPA